ncbi:maltose alpha-D-glucosyltransferase/ alpha-amylase [Nakamurella panacisegetis]|uniref:Maltose alpha-D-glucosyltransferase/ alpha-amylase n=1 Tax=Nakamurella panacisegetis TaxID=1090615 RepID=A0A1H0SVV1_9ACTN|nr:maltose alpha-D-glucosyltransferase [Nakamurella panacisegetis]SDP45436.1 maltose alpha-D-glucosyltransferase/ alpha-amylase [Nakamurella panacisegetis]
MNPKTGPTPSDDDPTETGDGALPSEVTFDEQFYPARPKALRPRARRRAAVTVNLNPPFEPDARNKAYVEWLVNQSMLGDATTLARQLAGQASMWAHPFAHPNPRDAVDKASVWFTAYPLSLITGKGQSFLSALGAEDLWAAFEQIGIKAVHTGPVKLAGGISGWEPTPSIDGHFDRMSMAIDPLFGTEEDFRAMCEAAGSHGGTIIDDIVPAHTGKGADFRLAEMNYRDYPGIYHMINIPEADWHLLPEVPAGEDSVNLSLEHEKALQEAGIIIGQLQRVIFYEPGIKETNWSATREIYDTQGQLRRWVYLHYFKAGQPSINWLDPTFAGMRLVMGDALHSLLDLGSGALRLDANGFLGVEKSAEESPAWSEGHPLSEAANHLIGSMVRKVGGFTFQELNLTIDAIKSTSEVGADLSYDFITRPGYQHALATGDTEFLRLTLKEGLAIGIDQASLVHAMQNHDELTYELVHFATAHAHDVYELGGEELPGSVLAENIRESLRQKLTGEAGPYNRVFTQNGIACTTASVITATLGFTDLTVLTPDDIERITSAHLLLAMYNAFQPGVFALSGWDLCGTLPLEATEVRSLIAGGDTRWIERGAHDLMGWNPEATASSSGMPKALSLYGTLPDQLADPRSFASRLSRILAVREQHGIATGQLLDIPDVPAPSVLVMVNRLAVGAVQITLLNFSEEPVSGPVVSSHFPPGGRLVDLATGEDLGTIATNGSFTLTLPGFGGLALIVKED